MTYCLLQFMDFKFIRSLLNIEHIVVVQVMSVLKTISQKASSVDRDALVELLRKNGTRDLEALGDSVLVESLIFVLKQKKYMINEGFFVDLAELLGIPYLEQ
jgi:uncharacterized protein YrrD